MRKLVDKIKRFTVNSFIKIIGELIERKNFSHDPILIVGSPRSGTTLLLSILGAHPDIHAIPRQTFAFDKWKSKKGNNFDYSPYRIDRLYRHLILHNIKKSAKQWCEKTPKHVKWIPYIADFYQDKLKIIHIIRDGRDVVVSSHPAHKKRKYWVPVESWVEYVQKGIKYKNKPYVYTLFYENLVSDYSNEIKKVLDFLNLPFTEEMKNWINETTIKESIHLRKGVREVHTNAIGKWKNDRHKQRIAEFMRNNEAVKLLYELGYR